MHQEHVDMVAGDFNGAAWRKHSGDDQRRDSTIEEAFANTNLPIPYGPTPLWRPGGVPGERADVPWRPKWHIRMHGAFGINHEVLGIKLTDQSLPPRGVEFTSYISTHGWLIAPSRDGHSRRPILSCVWAHRAMWRSEGGAQHTQVTGRTRTRKFRARWTGSTLTSFFTRSQGVRLIKSCRRVQIVFYTTGIEERDSCTLG